VTNVSKNQTFLSVFKKILKSLNFGSALKLEGMFITFVFMPIFCVLDVGCGFRFVMCSDLYSHDR